jgi:hypothetical protein
LYYHIVPHIISRLHGILEGDLPIFIAALEVRIFQESLRESFGDEERQSPFLANWRYPTLSLELANNFENVVAFISVAT